MSEIAPKRAARRRVAEILEQHETVTVPELVEMIATDTPNSEADAVEILDELERNGFIYLVPHDAPTREQEVRTP